MVSKKMDAAGEHKNDSEGVSPQRFLDRIGAARSSDLIRKLLGELLISVQEHKVVLSRAEVIDMGKQKRAQRGEISDIWSKPVAAVFGQLLRTVNKLTLDVGTAVIVRVPDEGGRTLASFEKGPGEFSDAGTSLSINRWQLLGKVTKMEPELIGIAYHERNNIDLKDSDVDLDSGQYFVTDRANIVVVRGANQIAVVESAVAYDGQAIVQALSKAQDPDELRICLWALANVLQWCPEDVEDRVNEQIDAAGGFNYIMDAFRTFPDDLHLQRAGLVLFACNHRTMCFAKALIADKLRVVEQASETFPDDPLIQATSTLIRCHVVMFPERPIEDSDVQVAYDENAKLKLVEHMIKTLQTFPEDNDVQDVLCRTMGNIMYNNKKIGRNESIGPRLQKFVSVHVIKCGGLDALRVAATRLADKYATLQSVFFAVGAILEGHPEERPRISTWAIECALNAMKRFPDRSFMQSNAMAVIGNLSLKQDQGDDFVIKEKLGVDGFRLILRAIQDPEHLDDYAMYHWAIRAMTGMGQQHESDLAVMRAHPDLRRLVTEGMTMQGTVKTGGEKLLELLGPAGDIQYSVHK